MTNEEYLSRFRDTRDINGKVISHKEEALKQALENRRAEIDLYWRRTAHFWTISAVALAGYIKVSSDRHHFEPFVSGLIAGVGLVLAVAWYLANKGSKFWQENWENHVAILSEDIIGPIYTYILSRDNGLTGEDNFHDKKYWSSLIDPTKPSPISVSKINQTVSLFFVLVWLVVLIERMREIHELIIYNECAPEDLFSLCIILMSLVYALAMILFTKTNNETHKPKLTVIMTNLSDPK